MQVLGGLTATAYDKERRKRQAKRWASVRREREDGRGREDERGRGLTSGWGADSQEREEKAEKEMDETKEQLLSVECPYPPVLCPESGAHVLCDGVRCHLRMANTNACAAMAAFYACAMQTACALTRRFRY
eukprot:1551156-Rhodomonas_salina.2